MKAVNLIPLEQRSGRGLGAGRSHGGAYAVLGVMAGLAIMALLYGKSAHAISSRKGEIATITARTQQAEAQADALAPYASFIQLQEKRVQAVETLLDSRFDWANAIHEVGRVLPSGISVSAFTGVVGEAGASPAKQNTSSGGAVASSTPPGSVPTFTLGGCAASQQLVAQMLTRLRLIEGVSEVQLTSSTVSSTGGVGGSAGSCPPHDPTYAVQVIFQPLPSAAAVTAAATKAKLADASLSTSTAAAAAAGGNR